MLIGFDEIDISFRDYEDFIIIYNLRTKEILRIEEVAADVWRIISKSNKINLENISKKISEIYDCKIEEIYKDIEEFIFNLYDMGVLMIGGKYTTSNLSKIKSKSENNIDYESILIKEMQKRNQLYSVTLEMTYACNEKCVHCYADFPKESNVGKVISSRKYKEIIDELHDMNCLHLAFTGGDPFMYKDFFDVFSYAREKGFICDIYTNAQYLADNENRITDLLKLRPRVFYISLYGSNALIHDKVTLVPGSFDKTLKVIKILKENNISVVLNIMLLSINSDDSENIINLAKSLGVEYRIGMSIIYKNNGDSSPMNYFINDKKIIKNILKINQDNIYSMDVSIEKFEKTDRICGAGSTSISISPDGNVYPCISLKEKLGDIFSNKIEDIWNCKKRYKLVDSILWKNTNECMKCENRDECPHCIGISQQESGDMFSCNTCDKLIAECLHELYLDKK